MNDREKIAHLLRRFGLGAGKFEVDEYAKFGVEGTIDRLINYDQVDDRTPRIQFRFKTKKYPE